MKNYNNHPVSNVIWVHRDNLICNEYNPNKVFEPEMDLISISIIEDGWLFSIVAYMNEDPLTKKAKPYRIIDGFHRYKVSGSTKKFYCPRLGKKVSVYDLTNGYVPVIVLQPLDETSKRMTTIRLNRAKGVHGVLPMADIVKEMYEAGISKNEIMDRLKMEDDEVERLLIRVGVAHTDIVTKADWSNSWSPK